MTLREFLGGDLTPLEHAIYGVIIQIIVTVVLWWFSPMLAIGAGTAAPIGLYFGREHAQQQAYFSGGDDYESHELGVWDAAKFWRWDWASQMDLYCPTVASLLCAGIMLLFV